MCNCKNVKNKITLGLEDLVKVRYTGTTFTNIIGGTTGVDYGKRMHNQVFYIDSADVETTPNVELYEPVSV